MPFPLIKLLSLFIKQASKPMANAIKRKAKEHPTFRQICIVPANLYHSWDVNVKMRLLGMGKTKTKHKMDPDMAVELGADMIGEGFLYMFASAILIAEYAYMSRNSEKKEAEKRQQIQSLEGRVTDLGEVVASLTAQVQTMEGVMSELEKKNKSLLDRLRPGTSKG